MESITNTKYIILVSVCLALCIQFIEAGQGCPFDNASCQEYCSQQGCNFGYCGHFAWTQCICRKCGNEWGYYDKIHYNPDKQVNQTELESLKLNGSEPLVLTNNGQQQASRQQQQQEKQQEKQVHATLTTLLIPDLSDGSKLDLNDIPDENSEKFLDFLAKNHEKLVQATSQQQQLRSGQLGGLDLADESLASSASSRTTTTTIAPTDEASPADETVEIQISSSNNNTNVNKREGDEEDADEGGERNPSSGSVTRLLKMAVAERSSDEIERRR